MNIILIGFKAVGKTTYGKALAKEKEMHFIDSDNLIEKINKEKKDETRTFRSIFNKYGEKYFRQIEKEAIKRITKMDNKIVSLGGGAVENNLKEIKSLGKVIYLKDDKEVLFSRIKRKGFPKFFDKDNPRKSFDKLYEKRKKEYGKVSDIELDISGLKKTDVIKKIEGELK